MAYGFGNTVNPQLGATNYSGFLQGALSGAQMQAQGGAAIAQGLQSAIAGAGAGVKKYLENKETKEMLNSALPNITSSLEKNQFLRESLGITDPTDKNQIRVAIKGFGGGDIRKGLAYVNQLFAQEARADRESAESKRQASGFAKALAPGPSPLALAAGSGERFENLPTDAASANQPDPTRAQAFKRATDAGVTNPALLQAILASTLSPQETRRSDAEIAKIEAETTALGVPKTPTKTEFDKRLDTRIQEFQQVYGRLPSISEIKLMQDEVVKTPNQAQDPYGVIAATRSFENDDKLVTTAQNAYDRELPRLYQTLDLLNSGNVNAGIFSELKTEIDRIKSSILNDRQAGKKASDSQVFDALTGSRVFTLFQQLGLGARGLDTPAERMFMIEVLTGRRTFELDALKELTRLAIKDNENVVKNYARKYETGSLDRYFTSTQNTEPLIAIRPKEVSPDDWAFMTQEERDQFAIKKK
jgi:hypothetical protein